MPQPQQEFRAFTIRHDLLAARIQTPAQVSDAYDPDHVPDLIPVMVEVKALWDTGATGSVITATTARALSLIPSGRSMVRHAGGTSWQDTYVVNVILPNKVGIVGVRVSECSPDVGDFGLIIGMDIITKGDLAISNVSGHTCMTFRYPSVATTDYVEDFNRHRYAGVPRNAPCPCGALDASGKPVKFKRCHGRVLGQT